jgi:hypothetical protein
MNPVNLRCRATHPLRCGRKLSLSMWKPRRGLHDLSQGFSPQRQQTGVCIQRPSAAGRQDG